MDLSETICPGYYDDAKRTTRPPADTSTIGPALPPHAGEIDGEPSDRLAHALLRVVGDHPGHMGRMRAARIIGGFSVPHVDDAARERMESYAAETSWTLRELVRLVDAMIGGGLVTQTIGLRPTLVLTRQGHRALDALESVQRDA